MTISREGKHEIANEARDAFIECLEERFPTPEGTDPDEAVTYAVFGVVTLIEFARLFSSLSDGDFRAAMVETIDIASEDDHVVH